MKKEQTDILKLTYESPNIKTADVTTEYGTLADHFSGGATDGNPPIVIDPDPDDSDDAPRINNYSAWDY